MVEKQLGYKYQVYNEIKKNLESAVHRFVRGCRYSPEMAGFRWKPIRERWYGSLTRIICGS